MLQRATYGSSQHVYGDDHEDRLNSTCHRHCGGDIGLGEIVNQEREGGVTTSDLQDLYRV